ncbi:hypothetical protein STRDD11_01843 [Streptococcus sp. DD11]|nr:hypothetical protein STRDD11_01843 [Streptococcus sp. DD11]
MSDRRQQTIRPQSLTIQAKQKKEESAVSQQVYYNKAAEKKLFSASPVS